MSDDREHNSPTVTIWPRSTAVVSQPLKFGRTRARGRIDWSVYECSESDRATYDEFWGVEPR